MANELSDGNQRRVRLALLALAAPQDQIAPGAPTSSPALAVVIGIRQDEAGKWLDTEWHCRIVKLDEFIAFLDGNITPAENQVGGQTNSEIPSDFFASFKEIPTDSIISTNNTSSPKLNLIGISDGSGGETEERLSNNKKDLWIDRLYRVFFFSAPSQESLVGEGDIWYGCGRDKLTPLLSLQTAAWIIDGLKGESVEDRKWVLSRIKLYSNSSWIGSSAISTKLLGYSLVAHIPVAVNSHIKQQRTNTNNDPLEKRFDTRVIMVADTENDSKSSLWDTEDNKGLRLPIYSRNLNLYFSESDDLVGNPTEERKSLSALIYSDDPEPEPVKVMEDKKNNKKERASLLPILNERKGKTRLIGSSLYLRQRKMGFSKVGKVPYQQLALRVEAVLGLESWQSSVGSVDGAWDQIVRSNVDLKLNSSQLNNLESGEEKECLIYAQEQSIPSIQKIDLHSPPETASEWIITARINSKRQDTSQIGPIESAVINRLSELARVSLNSEGAARPSSGLSLLPPISSDGVSKSLDWQMVGMMKAPTFRRRILLNVDEKQFDDPTIGLDSEREIEFFSLQPVSSGLSSNSQVTFKTDRRYQWLIDGTGTSVLDSFSDNDAEKPPLFALRQILGTKNLNFSEEDSNQQPYVGVKGSVIFGLFSIYQGVEQQPEFQIGSLKFRATALTKLAFAFQYHPNGFTKDEKNIHGGDVYIDGVKCYTELPIQSFRPVSQDDSASSRYIQDQSHCDLLFNIPSNQSDGSQSLPAFFLRLEEQFGMREDHNLLIRLNVAPSVRNKVAIDSLLIIDPSPFRVARVPTTIYDASFAGIEIAIFSRDASGFSNWKYNDPSQDRRLYLPPQSIGEAIDGSEIKDKLVPAFIGKPTELRYDPTYRNQATSEAPWNLRSLLNRFSSNQTGVEILELKSEIAYGLVTSLSRNDSNPIYIAELSGVIGIPKSAEAMPASYSSQINYNDSIYIRSILSLQQQRVAVEKVWRGRPESAFMASSGVSFTLRGLDRSRHDLNFSSNDLITGVYAAFNDRELSELQKYYGGQSRIGDIGNVHISALGGWANQRVDYNNVRIDIESRMGRIFTYRKELVGRIGVLHNRAKYITIYQRTVVPGTNGLAPGRAVLRQTDQYIEILQPEVRFANGSPTIETGCFIGAKFLTTRIPISDNQNLSIHDGTKVNLYNKNAKLPKPLVELIFIGEDGEERRIMLESVEKLVFFTGNNPEIYPSDRVELWPPIPDIDYCNYPAPRLNTLITETTADDLHDGFLPDSDEIPLGHQQFTWTLVKANLPLMLSAGRSNTGASAALHQITVSRARPTVINPADKFIAMLQERSEVSEYIAKALARIQGEFEKLRNILNLPFESIKQQINSKIESEKKKIEARLSLYIETLYNGMPSDNSKSELSNSKQALINTLEEISSNIVKTNSFIDLVSVYNKSYYSASSGENSVEDKYKKWMSISGLLVQNRKQGLPTVYQDADNVMRLIAAVGSPPSVAGLVLNRKTVSYLFSADKPVVEMSRCLALVNRIDNLSDSSQLISHPIKPLAIRQPIQALAADLVPERLEDIPLNKLIPDLAGLKLDDLIPSLKIPSTSDKIHVNRGFDKQRQEAWLDVKFATHLENATTIIEVGPLRMLLENGFMAAQSRTTVTRDGRSKADIQGEIRGNWKLLASGFEAFTFIDTSLSFDQSGKLDFRLSPQNVRLSPQLDFISKLLNSLNLGAPSGVELIYRDQIPAGVLCKLAIPLPSVATGAFAITGLTVATTFGIYFYPEFEIGTSLDIGSKLAPFTLAIWLLNGGGYISMSLTYIPTRKPAYIRYSLEVAIVAGVGIALNLYIASGSVWIQIGCSVQFTWLLGSSDSVITITVFILLRGSVEVLGLITVAIDLLLEASYNGNDLVARGTLRLSVRISFFYTFKCQKSVQIKLSGTQSANDDYALSFA